MRWQQSRRSDNVVDARGRRAGRRAALGCGPLLILGLLAIVFGADPMQILQLVGESQQGAPQVEQAPAANDEASDFIRAVLGDMEDTWRTTAPRAGINYRDPELVLYSGMVQSACGMNSAATGPFYCPSDQRIYLDLTFFRELERYGASGDFAIAYVIAHEFGHHIQNLSGTLGEVQRLQNRSDQRTANELSVRTELQADCYGGVWGYHARDMLERGDVEEGIDAAAAVGDDRMQQMAGRRVTPDAFTHGSSRQRTQAFQAGFQSGNPRSCDTFADMR
ncbi:MAG: neutral zinc metallopeptidase [Rubricoccaceae bacterium]|nr:neutral zinc metallopeptidase [Rubricoccaceae bacterium]